MFKTAKARLADTAAVQRGDIAAGEIAQAAEDDQPGRIGRNAGVLGNIVTTIRIELKCRPTAFACATTRAGLWLRTVR
jgi:hypothetical protein